MATRRTRAPWYRRCDSAHHGTAGTGAVRQRAAHTYAHRSRRRQYRQRSYVCYRGSLPTQDCRTGRKSTT